MKTSILFYCLMIVGGLSFGQTRLTPDPGDAANTPGAVVSPPGTSATTSGGGSGGSTVSSGGGGGGGSTFEWPDLEDLADFLSGLAFALSEEEDD